ncbi:MAG TPA: Rid family hydrolase, partial [Solirubrobacteraceae bacterium]
MTTSRRINVHSGRQLETIAHYSRALRVGDTVLQAGTTSLDRAGEVRGKGDVAAQVDAIMKIAAWSMGKAGGRLADVVRNRMYVTDMAGGDAAARAAARYFRDARPAATLVQVNGLNRPEMLIEIELDAVDGAGASATRVSSGRPTESEYSYCRALRVGDRVFISGTTTLNASGQVEAPGDMYRQTRLVMDTIFRALAEAGGVPGDLVYTKTYVTELTRLDDYTRGWVEALGEVRPVSTLLGIPALLRPEMLIEVEAEAILGAAKSRRDIYTEHMREKPRGYARAVAAGDTIHVSGCTSMSSKGEVQAAGDWAAQSDLAMDVIRGALGQAGATLDDVVRRRTFTVAGARQDRAHGEGPTPFAKS